VTTWASWKPLWDKGCPKPEGYPVKSQDYDDMVHMAAIRWLVGEKSWSLQYDEKLGWMLEHYELASQVVISHKDLDEALRFAVLAALPHELTPKKKKE